MKAGAEPKKIAILGGLVLAILVIVYYNYFTGDSETPVIPILVGDDYKAFGMAKRLSEEGVFVNPVVSPATPKGRALLRTSYMATHTERLLSRALDAFAKVGREFGVIA